MTSHFIAQAGLEILDSSNLPASASQVAGAQQASNNTAPALNVYKYTVLRILFVFCSLR
jgi:hypothetical protein